MEFLVQYLQAGRQADFRSGGWRWLDWRWELTLTLVIGQQSSHVMGNPGRILKHVDCLSLARPVQVSVFVFVVLVIVGQQQVLQVLVKVVRVERPAVSSRRS